MRTSWLSLSLLSATLLTAACNDQASPGPEGPTAPIVSAATELSLDAPTTNRAAPAAKRCALGHRNGADLPDPACTPGSLNAAVNQTTLDATICKAGWTATVRPPTSVTNKLKRQLIAAYDLPADTQGELDHLVSLQLGGALADPANLWVEPGRIPNSKDAVENKLHAAVCSGLVPLAVTQQAIARDWTTAFDVAGLRIVNGTVCLRAAPARCVTARRGDEDGG